MTRERGAAVVFNAVLLRFFADKKVVSNNGRTKFKLGAICLRLK